MLIRGKNTTGNSRRRARRDRHRFRPWFRPDLTLLEDRQLLSTATVTGDAPTVPPPDVINTNDSGSGSLRYAINHASYYQGTSKLITFSSLFDTPQTINLTSGPLKLRNTATITIQGPGAGLLTIDGGNSDRVFTNGNGDSAYLSGLTITGGHYSGAGAGVYNNGGSLTLANCVVTGNTSESGRGGGIDNEGGAITLTNTTLSHNIAAIRGGGLENTNGGTATLNNCTISDNSVNGDTGSNNGGGLDNSGNLTLTNCTVSGNSATSNGGGLNNDGTATATLTNVTIYHNSATYGGGLANGGTATLALTNVTVSGNSAKHGNGGGLYSEGGTATLTNTIVAGNTGGDVLGAIAGSNNLIGTGAPGLAPLGDYGGPTETMALLPGSPAIGGGIAVGGVTTDQRGMPLDSPPDIGAFQTSPLIVNTIADGPVGAGLLTLRQAINIANAEATTAETISFSSLFNTAQAIALNGTQLELANTAGVTITGPGAGLLSISGNNASRVFYIDNGASAALSGLTITGGNAVDGGGLDNREGTLALTNVTVSGNYGDHGGGLYNYGGTLTLTDSTVSGNSSNNGGGGLINNFGGTATLTNTTISGNSATNHQAGGGVANGVGATLNLINCTVSGNSTNGSGGGLFNTSGGGPFPAGTAKLTNTIVAGNTQQAGSGDVQGALASTSSYNLIGDGTGMTGISNGSQGNQVGVPNPGLVALADNGGPTQTMALLPGSPAINAGTNTGAPATDQRGFNRIVGGTVDIGAFESQIVVTPPADQSALPGQSTSIDLGSFSDETPSPGPGTSTVVVNFGDGSANVTLTDVSPGGLGSLTHTFASAGAYTVTVTASDTFGNADQAGFTVNVQAATTSVSAVSMTWGTQTLALNTTGDHDQYLLPAGRTHDVPFANISSFTIALGQPATLAAGDVQVTGIAVANYGPVTISGSGTTYTITLAQPVMTADRVTIAIANSGIVSYTRELDVLPGDFNDDGAVSISDAIQVRNIYLGITTTTSVFADINGDGVVNAADYNLVRSFIGTTLPPPKQPS